MRPTLIALAAAALPLVVTACADNGSTPGDDGESYNCATETRADIFAVNLEKPGVGGVLDFKLLTAEPAPPARNDNTWTLQINSMASGVVGNPMTGASLNVTPFMPDHQHGTPIEVKIEALATAGEYKLSPVNMWMPGLWETTIVATAGTTSDSTVYRFCIPE